MFVYAKKYGRFLGWQLVVVLLNVISGFVVIRALSKTDYAYYTMVLAVMSMFTSITSTGIDPIMYAVGGKIWKDKGFTGILVNTALKFRQQVFLVFAVPLLGYFVWQINQNNAPTEYVYLFSTLIVVGGATQLRTGIYIYVLRLNNRIHTLQKSELISGASKFLGFSLLYLIAPSLLLFLIVTVGVLFFQYYVISREGRIFAVPTDQIDGGFKQKIGNLFKSNIVNSIYWAFQGQVLLFICSVFGTTENIGEVGALGRLALLLAPVSMLVANYFHPAAAKAFSSREILMNVLKACLWVGMPVLGLLLIARYFPQGLLWILGNKYHGLENLLLLFLSISFINVFQGIISGFCVARGWVRWYFLYSPFIMALQVALVLILKMTTLRDILIFHGLVEVFTLLLITCFFLDGFIQYKITEGRNF